MSIKSAAPAVKITPAPTQGITVSLDQSRLSKDKRPTREELQQLIKSSPAAIASNQESEDDEDSTIDTTVDDDDTDLSSLEGDDDGDGEGDDDGEGEGEGSGNQDTLSAFENDERIVIDEEAPDNGTLEIYRPECLKCKALVPHEEKTWKKCHFSAGNERCPAQSVKIVVGIPVDSIVQAFIVSEQTANMERLARLYAQLSTKPEWQQQQITAALTKRREDLLVSSMSKSKLAGKKR